MDYPPLSIIAIFPAKRLAASSGFLTPLMIVPFFLTLGVDPLITLVG